MNRAPQANSDRYSKPESLQLLLTAFPLLPVSRESCGGAEQVLTTLESSLASRGHRTTVAACDGSRASGHVFSTGAPAELDQFATREKEHNRRIIEMLRQPNSFDLVHDHSGLFWPHAGTLDLPVLSTLHLPREFYPAELLKDTPQNVFFNCVSDAQRRTFSGVPRVIATVRNGISLQQFPFEERKDDYLLWMGRLCPEKGAHVAIEVAQKADIRLVIAGGIYPFSYHQEYFERDIRPHLSRPGSKVEYVGIPSLSEKLALLANARALLNPSLIDETSSLTAMEAMACGTPVVAHWRGALPEVIVDGTTGLLARDIPGLVQALGHVQEISPHECRRHVEQNYSAEHMADSYEALYSTVMAAFRQGTSVTASATRKPLATAQLTPGETPRYNDSAARP